MASNSALPFLNAANINNAITGLTASGFSVYGATNEVNVSGTDNYRYVAWKKTNDITTPTFKMQTGYYIGNGTVKTIAGLGFNPQLVMIKPDTTAGVGMIFKTTSMHDLNSSFLPAVVDTAGMIKLIEGGFQLSSSANVNSANIGHS